MTIRDALGKFADYFSRKFLLAVAALATGTWVCLDGKDIMGFATLVGVVLASYNGANVAETFAVVKKAIADKKAESGDTSGAKVKVDVDTGT